MNNQCVNTDICGGVRVFAQQRVVDPCDFSMAQYWQHNQHQFLSHQDVYINSSSAKLLPQQNDVYPTNDLNQHTYMSYQGGHTDICSLDELIAQWSAFIKDQPYDQHQLMIHQGGNFNTSNAHELLPQQNDTEPVDALMIQEQHYD